MKLVADPDYATRYVDAAAAYHAARQAFTSFEGAALLDGSEIRPARFRRIFVLQVEKPEGSRYLLEREQGE